MANPTHFRPTNAPLRAEEIKHPDHVTSTLKIPNIHLKKNISDIRLVAGKKMLNVLCKGGGGTRTVQ
jgi:hypothetical protein